MRIISKFRDYYDRVQIYGFEPLLYVREQKVVEDEGLILKKRFSSVPYSNCGILGFCGKLYPFVFYTEGFTRAEWHCAFDSETAFPITDTIFQRSYSNRLKSLSYRKESRRRNELEQFFDQNTRESKLFDKYNVPIFVSTKQERVTSNSGPKEVSIITLNPQLKEYGFFRVFGPNEAYQEIYQWLSNKASPEKPIPKIDDVTLAEAKGFDKWSFRKEKQNAPKNV